MMASGSRVFRVRGIARNLRVLLFGGVLGVVAAALGGCVNLRTDVPREESQALVAPPAAALVQAAAAQRAATGGESAFRLLETGRSALAARLSLVERAQSSLDLQYYIFRYDTSGKLLLEALLRAADRGVRVRLLLDDMYSPTQETVIIGLDSHPNIQVRLYNPFTARGNVPLGRALEYFAEDGRPVGRRMHNKLLVADGSFGVTGGRNIGDEYFQLHDDLAFQDLDVLAVGRVVDDLGVAFDLFWNADESVPARAIPRPAPRQRLSAQLREEVQAARATMADAVASELGGEVLDTPVGGDWGPWIGGRAELLLDEPAKTGNAVPAAELPATRLLLRGLEVRQELLIASPYFVPGRIGVDFLHYLRGRGVKVRVLTNSLAANDVSVVHAGYTRYRVPLLIAGVELHELKPSKERPFLSSLGSGSSRASLHGKALVFDRDSAYVGSMNLDPRSALLNTEAGLLLHGPQLAGAVAMFIERGMAPHNSYQVRRDPEGSGGDLIWRDEFAGKVVEHREEPRTNPVLRALIRALSVLPIEGDL